ncbi:MAG: hypothetical protein H0U65_13885 [Rubrobacter sp.]|nr:hypothetical protein [Rubrobacter sp.]
MEFGGDSSGGFRTALLALSAGVVLAAALVFAASPASEAKPGDPKGLRVAAYNVEDVRTEDVKRNDNPRLKEIAATIQKIEPDIVLLNELAYDEPGAPDVEPGDGEGENARRFVENYLSKTLGTRTQTPSLRHVHGPVEHRDFERL